MKMLKKYRILLETKGPVFIGSGEKIGKKEYVFEQKENKVRIPDLPRMFQGLRQLKLDKAYENYLLYEREDLVFWFRNKGVTRPQYSGWMAYDLDSGDAVIEKRSKKEILLFIKDAYGCPFIPGSSLKGAIRTALLSQSIRANLGQYDEVAKRIKVARADGRRNRYLQIEGNQLEAQAFHVLKRNTERKDDLLNDILAGLRISDSKPISIQSLVLCQKIDVNLSGEEKKMPLLRECLKPGVTVEFDMTIDSGLLQFDENKILDAIQDFYSQTYEVFLRAFKIPKSDNEHSMYVGGGSGFVSKTAVYPLFGKEEGVRQTSKIIDNTLPRKQRDMHKHSEDVRLGVSPHVVKMTRYRGALHEMGLTSIKINPF